MSQQQIVVTVSPDGEVQVEAQGVRGAGCQQLTAALEKALGERTADQKKPEYYQQAQATAGQGAQTGAK